MLMSAQQNHIHRRQHGDRCDQGRQETCRYAASAVHLIQYTKIKGIGELGENKCPQDRRKKGR